MTIPLGPPSPTGSGSQPGSLGREKPWGLSPARSLFGLAPGGACHAADVAAGAVGSYPTVSPLPAAEAVGRSHLCGAFPRVTPGGRYPPPSLPGVRTFLDPRRAAAIRPSARRPPRRAPRRGQRRRQRAPAAPPRPRPPAPPLRPRAGTAAGTPPAPRPSRPPARRSPPPPPPRRNASQSAAAAAPASAQTARPPSASRRQSNFGPGSALRPGAMSECAITPAGRDAPARHDPVEQRLQRRHLRLGERREVRRAARRWRARSRSSAS